MTINIKQVRDRAWLSLSPQTAAAAGMSLAQLQQFVAGAYTPAPEEIERLARHMGMR